MSVSQLEARLSWYLRHMKRGGEVQILERGIPVARLTRVRIGDVPDRDGIEALVRAGILRGGSGDVSWILDETPIRSRGGSLAAARSSAPAGSPLRF